VDDGFTLVEIGRNFTYFGDMYDKIYIATNGFASFGNETGDCPDCNAYPATLGITSLPSTIDPRNVLAPFWTDLNLRRNGTLSYKRYYMAFDDRFVIQWKNVPENDPFFQGSPSNSFQIVLDFESECIFYRYGSVGIELNTKVVVGYSDITGLLPETETECEDEEYCEQEGFDVEAILSGEVKCIFFCPELPSDAPSSAPSRVPSSTPSDVPSTSPSQSPSDEPSVTPSDEPSGMPSQSPSALPSSEPSLLPSSSPSSAPSSEPSYVPSVSLEPSESPSLEPSLSPSGQPSQTPSQSNAPSNMPSESPSEQPSTVPSSSPSDAPSSPPTMCYPLDAPLNTDQCTGTVGDPGGGGGDMPCCSGLFCCVQGTVVKCKNETVINSLCSEIIVGGVRMPVPQGPP